MDELLVHRVYPINSNCFSGLWIEKVFDVKQNNGRGEQTLKSMRVKQKWILIEIKEKDENSVFE